MAASYKKLWKLLIDKGMKKKDHCISEGCGDKSQSRHFEADRNAGSEMKKSVLGYNRPCFADTNITNL